ncbi:PepSY domain-containing protein [Halorussus sp. MSC15.2]|uniref:PepSY domain-containing protein n=1 Tax=Halorussus sp. MSC15.2 TaxID=2283638 RepID=UPI0013D227BA|nr:hypothetical protein [Halorussus sp. MSC15.2]NEU56368.1 hypothetical protein [Halorussus sp. MSC15.2]
MNGRTLLSVGLSALLVASVVAVGAGSAVAASSADRSAVEGGQYLQDDGAQNQTTGGLNLSELNVTAYEAAVLAQNETGGTVLGVRLKRANGTPGYEVLVANETGNVTGVVVNGTDAGIIQVSRNIAQVNQTVLQQQGISVSDIGGAVSAVEAAQQEVGDEFVPIEVAIEAEPNFTGQQVTFVSPNATQSVVVDLTNGSVVQVSDVTPKRGAEAQMTATEQANETTEAAMVDSSAMGAMQDDGETEGCCVGDDELSHEFGDASEFVAPTLTGFGEQVFAADDEFDTADDFGPFTGVEGEEDENLFDGGEEEEEGEGFIGEEDEDGWF